VDCLLSVQLPPLPPPKISPHEQKHPTDPPPPYRGLLISLSQYPAILAYPQTYTSILLDTTLADPHRPSGLATLPSVGAVP